MNDASPPATVMTTPGRVWRKCLETLRRLTDGKAGLLNWREFLAPYQGTPPLLSNEFIDRWGDERWSPNDDDRNAAARLHTQIESRIATQRLGYLDGVEKAALDSLYVLFQKTRDIVDQYPACRHLDAIAWEVLNGWVRPFTAKWHRQSERGRLDALDATDEFRADLAELQPVLRQLARLLIHIRDGRAAPPPSAIANPSRDQIEKEMSRAAAWGIPAVLGALPKDVAAQINGGERSAILARRDYYAKRHSTVDPNKPHAVGLALSGGGIRSATFSLGLLVALARRGILPQVDYLSTVSGGGYLGAFLSAFLESPRDENIGLGPTNQPFSREHGEAPALRHIRHQSKYLASGSWWQRAQMIAAQLLGMLLNTLAIGWLVAAAVLVERAARETPWLDGWRAVVTTAASFALAVAVITALAILRFSRTRKRAADAMIVAAAAFVLSVVGWYQLPAFRTWVWQLQPVGWAWISFDKETWLAVTGAIPLLSSASAVLFGPAFHRVRLVMVVAASIATPLFLAGLYFAIAHWVERGASMAVPLVGSVSPALALSLAVAFGTVVYVFLFDINATSPHRHYRDRLASAYLIQPAATPTAERPFESGVALRLSDLGKSGRAPYHLINCALNVPGSNDPRMQGRRTDFFLFSARYCGSPLIGYRPTAQWEAEDGHLDLGTAMAISAAGAAPQMGLGTLRHWSFWLALLNVRLGYWQATPMKTRGLNAPGLALLLREMLGNMHEKMRWLSVSDGGHIENLGVYELLRRRCKYIIAVDGEEDANMTFQALTTLQRMAAIDFGVRIDLDLDDLRVNAQGFSRSHFRFCRIHYPADPPVAASTGYLLYVKLSLTGNEGEFIRRYRLDEPIFPHHSTADQLFSEAQFEAYRLLGEHIGDKLFLRPIVGDLGGSDAVPVEEWFRRLGMELLEVQSAPADRSHDRNSTRDRRPSE